jgi:hypothetical protein
MSELRLVVRDVKRSIHSTCHGGFADRVIAALSAEPETIEELDRAIQRFEAPRPNGFFRSFATGTHDEPHDAGIVMIDLAGRVVVCESSYSSPGPRGEVPYHNGQYASDRDIQYHLPGDWLFTSEFDNWRSLMQQRRQERLAQPPLDARAVLYGKPMLIAVAGGCWKGLREQGGSTGDAADNGPMSAMEPLDDGPDYGLLREIHATWLMTPRDDLNGESPRDVMMAKHDFVDWDLQDREFQWSALWECPIGLDRESHAYRFAGFGTHELVVYYYLVRHLLDACRDLLAGDTDDKARIEQSEFETLGDFLVTEVPRLERLREEWLDTRDSDLGAYTPRDVLARERARIPIGETGGHAMIDHDCPLCQMSADLPGPMFWHLDGCNMDPDFAFSFYHTREEWEEHEGAYEEFDRRFREKEAEQQRLGVPNPGSGSADPDSVWKRSFVAREENQAPLEIRLFAVGTYLAELIVDLKEPTEDRPLIDRLSRDFGNLREVAWNADLALAAGLIEPVLDHFCETLDLVAQNRADLESKTADLQQRLRHFLEPPRDTDSSGEWDPDADPPF